MYPVRYSPLTDFVRNEQLGNDIPAAAVQAELTRVAESMSQVIALLKRTHTSDGKLKLDQAVRLKDVITQSALGTGNGVQTVFNFLTQIDPVVDLVRVFVNNVLTTPLSITASAITFSAAPANGHAVTVDVYTNLGGVIDRLQSVVQNEGASLIGVEDLASNFTAADVEGALAELAASLTALETAIGDVGGFVLRDGTRGLTGQWELNAPSTVTIPPAPAAGALVMGTPADTNILTISDGVTSFVFEFDNNSTVTSPRIPVAIGGTPTITATNLVNAVNAAPLAIRAASVGPNVTFTHEIPYALGNQTIVFAGTGITGLVGMAGGVDGIFSSGQYKTHYRIRNCPPSLREGDVVVHQQLATVLAQVTAALQAFLRLDGSNEMVNDLDMGNNQVIDMAPGTAPSHGTTVSQVETLIATAQNSKLSLNGLKDTALEGTLTGPVTFGQSATAVADTDQTTTPASVAIPTLSGVPKPGANDHVANKKYVDDAIVAALPSGGGTEFVDFDIEGDGLPAGAIVNLNAGGEFYFEDLTIAAAQSLTCPTRIFCEGNFNLQNTGSIVSTAPLELVVTGTVTISATITCPFLSIRAGGAVSIAAAVNTHVDGSNSLYAYPEFPGKNYGGPDWQSYGTGIVVEKVIAGGSNVYDAVPLQLCRHARDWRAIIVATLATLSVTANLTSDDIFLKSVGTTTITSTLRAFWYVHSTFDIAASPVGLSWNDGVRNYTPIAEDAGSIRIGTGGVGGTAGGYGQVGGGGASPFGASVYRGSHRPYLFPTYKLARGTPAAYCRPTHLARGGGRISVYSGADLVLTAATLNVNGLPGVAGGNQRVGGGGGGVARAIAAGTLTDGNATANGGTDPAYSAHGGGGMVAFVASAFSGTQSGTATSSAQAGTVVLAAAIPAVQIQALEQRGVFEVFPDAA